jgi:hypothetical protein
MEALRAVEKQIEDYVKNSPQYKASVADMFDELVRCGSCLVLSDMFPMVQMPSALAEHIQTCLCSTTLNSFFCYIDGDVQLLGSQDFTHSGRVRLSDARQAIDPLFEQIQESLKELGG